VETTHVTLKPWLTASYSVMGFFWKSKLFQGLTGTCIQNAFRDRHTMCFRNAPFINKCVLAIFFISTCFTSTQQVSARFCTVRFVFKNSSGSWRQTWGGSLCVVRRGKGGCDKIWNITTCYTIQTIVGREIYR